MWVYADRKSNKKQDKMILQMLTHCRPTSGTTAWSTGEIHTHGARKNVILRRYTSRSVTRFVVIQSWLSALRCFVLSRAQKHWCIHQSSFSWKDVHFLIPANARETKFISFIFSHVSLPSPYACLVRAGSFFNRELMRGQERCEQPQS